MNLSPEIEVLLAPADAYRRYAPAHTRDGLWIALRRPAFVALLQGVVMAMVATKTVAFPVVLSLTLCWATAILAQLILAVAMIATVRQRRIPTSVAVDLLFMGHAPWSLWLLACAGAMTFAPTITGLSWILISTMLIPSVLTWRITTGYLEVVLGTSHHEAKRRALLHQAIVWAILIFFLWSAVALWPRILGWVGR